MGEMTTGPVTPVRVIRRRPASPPVYLLDVSAATGGRTRVRGALWDGVLNAGPEDTTDGPSPVEALLAAIAACLVRNLRWVADGAHLRLDRCDLHLAASRSDDPPAITAVHVDLELEATERAERVARVVVRALRTGTITRTVSRAATLTMRLTINGVDWPLDLAAVGLARG
jgi:uncharacterized OsmC-like protein